MSHQASQLAVVIERWVPQDTRTVLQFLKYLLEMCLISEGSGNLIDIELIRNEMGKRGSEAQGNLIISFKEKPKAQEVEGARSVSWSKIVEIMEGRDLENLIMADINLLPQVNTRGNNDF